MAKIGVKGLTYATYSSGGAGAAIVYSGGTALTDYMIRADLTEERADVPFYADDNKIDSDNSMTGCTVQLELANMTKALDTAFLGHTATQISGEELDATEAAAPFVGVGFIRKERFKGTVTYHAYWVYKVQFSKDGDSVNTKGESVEFQTETLSGTAVGVQLAAAANVIYYSHTRLATEAAARTWLNGKAGVS